MLIPERGDDISSYETEDIPEVSCGTAKPAELQGRVMLRRQENGHCWYLKDGKCSIHERAPYICKIFDCRTFFLTHTRNARRDRIKHNRASAEVFKEGRKRLDTLPLLVRENINPYDPSKLERPKQRGTITKAPTGPTPDSQKT